MPTTAAEVPVFLLCGGLGTRLREETEVRPKPMVPVGNRPILWHIMRSYAHFGFKRFVLCLGYKAEAIKAYFLDYASLNSDFTVDLKTDTVRTHSIDHEQDWSVTLAFTGDLTMTGARVALAADRYLGDAEHFAVSYGDGLTDANLAAEWEFHQSHGKTGTILGVNPPSRFGELKTSGSRVMAFEEKPEFAENWINGGYFFFRRGFRKYLDTDPSCVLERAPLRALAEDDELCMFEHPGYWACMDTQRDRDHLNELWDSGSPPWVPEPEGDAP